MRKLICVLTCLLFLGGCEQKGIISDNYQPSVSQETQLDKNTIEYLESRIYGLARANTYYTFNSVQELTPESLRLYLMEAANPRWYPHLEAVFDEQNKWQRGNYLSYDNIMEILTAEFETDTFPFDVNKPEAIFLNISPTELTGGHNGEKITFQESDEYIIAHCESNRNYDWFSPKLIASVDGKYFFKDQDLFSDDSPYVKTSINFVFKKREGKMPMLIKSQF